MKFTRTLLLFLLPWAVLAQTNPGYPGAPDWVDIQRNIAYGPYPATVLDILTPKDTAESKHPGVVVFHGGGWIRGTKESTWNALCLPYLKHGFVVANVEYRVASVATAPAAVRDALQAAHWFREHAAEFHVDTNRLVITGASAGGHLALMAGMTPASAELGPPAHPAAIVNCYGITDVPDLLDGAHRESWAVQWVPEEPGRMVLAKRVSPLTYVRKDLPPILTVQGENDHTVPHEQGVRLTEALKEAGADATMITVPNAGHGFSKDQWPDVHEKIFEFLATHGITAPTSELRNGRTR